MVTLTPDQKRVWDIMRMHEIEPSPGRTPEQASNFAVSSFLYWCWFDGLRPEPTQEAVTAEFEAAGVPELAPGDDFWKDFRDRRGRGGGT